MVRSTKNSTFAPVLKRGSLWYTLSLGYGVMVTLQILVLPFLVRVRVPQQIYLVVSCPGRVEVLITLGYGVMVTLQILVLPFLVRVRIPQLIRWLLNEKFNSFFYVYSQSIYLLL